MGNIFLKRTSHCLSCLVFGIRPEIKDCHLIRENRALLNTILHFSLTLKRSFDSVHKTSIDSLLIRFLFRLSKVLAKYQIHFAIQKALTRSVNTMAKTSQIQWLLLWMVALRKYSPPDTFSARFITC